MTRSQELMKLAEELVREVAEDHPDEKNETRKIYGGLCHEFPVMVRTCGLCQAVAFSLDKAGNNEKPREKAHELLLRHVAAVLGVDRNKLGEHIQGLSTVEYMLATRKIVSAWLFFKRFAVSILKVKDATTAKEGG